MTSGIRMHLEAIKTELASRMAYRADFFISTFLTFLFEFIVPLVTILIYSTGSSFPGWGLYETLLLQGVFMISKGIAYPFFFGIVYNVLGRVREGTFDLLLIKPRSVLHLAIATEFDSEELGKLAGGLILFVYALIHLPQPSIGQWLEFILLMVVSLAVIFSFALLMSGSVFKWVGNSRVYEMFNSISSFGFYPRSIFSKGLQTVISTVLPVAMIGFFPASVLLSKPTSGVIATTISSLLFLFISVVFWHWMLSKYTSAGG